MRVSISAVIITYNEESNIERCLHSLGDIAEEIIVVDSYSQDTTIEICKTYNVRIITHPFEGHVQQKNFAIAQATHPYILSLDGDEALSDELREEIRMIKENWSADAYTVKRLNNYCNYWIRHGGWYPDRKVRLWDRRKGSWGGTNPHDRVIIHKGSKIAHLKNDLLHYSFRTIAEHVSQLNYFSDISAREFYISGSKSYFWLHCVANPGFTFLRSYIIKFGFLDGFYGFVSAIIMAYGNFLKYSKLRLLNLEQPAEVYKYSTVGGKRSAVTNS